MVEKEYIERELAQKILADDYAYYAAKLLDTVPTADVQEVRYAHWEYFFDIEEMARCSNCYEVLKKGRASCYCPHCGAKMDKE